MKKSLVGQIKRPGQRAESVQIFVDDFKRDYDSVTVSTTAYSVNDKTFVLADDDTAGAAVTLTLPPVIDNTDKLVYVKKLGTTGNVVVDGNSSETIDGATTHTLTAQYESVTLFCSGSEWLLF